MTIGITYAVEFGNGNLLPTKNLDYAKMVAKKHCGTVLTLHKKGYATAFEKFSMKNVGRKKRIKLGKFIGAK